MESLLNKQILNKIVLLIKKKLIKNQKLSYNKKIELLKNNKKLTRMNI